ncbi:competence/damage-inducible protein A [Ottowia sp. GY511]|uniref:Competence/damage-inducible protein A n=1 Tax=Ottowia flava TaxID=2675430 RepID=A0ABW4KQB5_9BURK|nr:molybdopterin-binding protein [Ottowia sp. GY511]TXK28335.1 competence/damage-inducible protein A [Ottowia sp. GY511]
MNCPAFGLIVIGDEILSGKRADKHLPYFVQLLGERGLQLAWAEYVGDDPARITATLRRAIASGDVVFCTGGIGATPDDHTRQCAAAAFGRPLVLHPEAKRLIQERIADTAREKGLPYEPDRPDNLHRLNMGMFPEGARLMPNVYNKIPGFALDTPARAAIYFAPGFPVMAWPMMAWALDTDWSQCFRQNAWVEKSVIVLGAMEGTLTPVMERVEAAHPGVKVFSLPSVDHPEYGAHIDLGVKGEPAAVETAYADLRRWLAPFALQYGPEIVRAT